MEDTEKREAFKYPIDGGTDMIDYGVKEDMHFLGYSANDKDHHH